MPKTTLKSAAHLHLPHTTASSPGTYKLKLQMNNTKKISKSASINKKHK